MEISARECLQARNYMPIWDPHQAPSKNPNESKVQIKKIESEFPRKRELGNRALLSLGDRSLGELA